MDSAAWDERYSGADLIWSAGPNRWVEELAGDLAPGRALDVAAGEGRNAVWLAGRGWHVTATDFSPVAVDRVRAVAAERLGPDADRVEAVVADATAPDPGGRGRYDLVVVAYLHLPEPERRHALLGAAEAVAPGGHLLVVGHDSRNLAEGVGGPQDPGVLYGPDDVAADIAPADLVVTLAQTRDRPVETEDGPRAALDVVVAAHHR